MEPAKNPHAKNPQLEFDNERLYILHELKKLEKQVYGFINDCQPTDNSINSESQENCGKIVNNQPMQDSVSSSEKPPVCEENGELEYDVIGRLRVLEADLRLLEHTINIMRNREEGLELLREIAYHLQQLREIGIREIDRPDSPGFILSGKLVQTANI